MVWILGDSTGQDESSESALCLRRKTIIKVSSAKPSTCHGPVVLVYAENHCPKYTGSTYVRVRPLPLPCSSFAAIRNLPDSTPPASYATMCLHNCPLDVPETLIWPTRRVPSIIALRQRPHPLRPLLTRYSQSIIIP